MRYKRSNEKEEILMIYAYMLENTSHYLYIDNSILIEFLNENKIEEDNLYIDAIDDIERTELKKLIDILDRGDTLIVRSIADLSNNIEDVANALKKLYLDNIDLISLKENYYTYKSYYQAFLDFSSMQIYWREQKRLMGIQRAKKEKKMGRKKDIDKIETAIKLYNTREFTVKDVLKIGGISSSTLYRELKKRKKGNGE